MKVDEVAKRLRVSEETVRNWLRAGHLKGTRVGGRRAGWRVPVSEVERMERGESTTPGFIQGGAVPGDQGGEDAEV